MPWLLEVRAAWERMQCLHKINLLEVTHTAEPGKMHAALLADLMPAGQGDTPFNRIAALATEAPPTT